MILISKDDALFIYNELNQRAQHQINAYGMPDANLIVVIADLAGQLELLIQLDDDEVDPVAVAAFLADEPHEQFDEDKAASDDTAPASTTPEA